MRAGGNVAEVQGGRHETQRDHQSLPEHAERHPGPDRGAQHAQHQAVQREQRPGRETQGAHCTVRPEGGGREPYTTTPQKKTNMYLYRLHTRSGHDIGSSQPVGLPSNNFSLTIATVADSWV